MNENVKIIRAAIETEINGYRFYLDAAEKTSEPQVRTVWLDLAHDEVEHMRLLQGNLDVLSRSGHWEAFHQSLEEQRAVPHAPITGAKKPVPEKASTDLDALGEGLKVEERTYRFYEDAAKNATDPEARRVYARLANMEMGHYKLIEETILLFSDPSQWHFLEVHPIQEG